MARIRLLACVLAIICPIAPDALAHGLEHTVSRDSAVVVTIHHEDGEPFSDQHYEVFHVGDTVAFQTGRTDALGRVAFLPDRDGMWRVRVFSEDGHGIDVVVDAAAPVESAPSARAPGNRWSRAAMGVSVLFGIFGVVMLFARRRS